MSENYLNEERIVSVNTNEKEDDTKALRPQSLSDFTGQVEIKENLAIFISAAKKRGEAMDHTLFFGPPGLGKTTLASIVAKELGVGFRATSGPVISKAGDLAAILTSLQPNDVLFIDEIHRLPSVVEEILYPAMEDFQLDLIIGEGPSAKSVRIDLPQFTLVAATTRAGLISTPLRERFGIPLHMQYYTDEELSGIIKRGAKKLSFNLTDDGAFEIARRCRGTPRVAGRILRRVRDICTVAEYDSVNNEKADLALKKLDIDSIGLDRIDRSYMMTLAKNYGGGPAGIDTLSSAIGNERDVLEDVVEPFLIQKGLLQRTPRGRMLTIHAWKYIGLDIPKQFDSNQFSIELEKDE
ncbi:MAG: Holliday junction branch migration DNA helicase RuvB [Alphaproteobacteria bacterium]|nr:Holliday junction branch migration DNA helicase RuvB [Alphaproteobacteria bacterium]